MADVFVVGRSVCPNDLSGNSVCLAVSVEAIRKTENIFFILAFFLSSRLIFTENVY